MKRNIMLTALATGVMALAPVAAQAAQDQDKAADAPEATAQMSKGEKKLGLPTVSELRQRDIMKVGV